jgi:4-diphosphocytidyl-2-C-methyl-D-erythritol kinase
LKLLSELFNLDLSIAELKLYASQIGSDCTFFIQNKPAVVSGVGNIITPIELDLNKYYIHIVYPQIHVDTKNAYNLMIPHKKPYSLHEVVLSPIHTWKEKIINDFEEPIFRIHPQLSEIKTGLYSAGALYASMTGSGSALYGIFEKNIRLDNVFPSCKIWKTSPIN